MGAIVRNFLLAFVISTFAFFGMLGKRPEVPGVKYTSEQLSAKKAESNKETFTLFSVIALTWVLCFWRCNVINKRLHAERLYKQRFEEYMRSTVFNRQYR
jgi:hypothetical protein